jgi:hypothetical protein
MPTDHQARDYVKIYNETHSRGSFVKKARALTPDENNTTLGFYWELIDATIDILGG